MHCFMQGRRDKFIVATKFGIEITPQMTPYYDSSREAILKSLDLSLQRLGTDYIGMWVARG
jgi:aryl-alcohol dehydrogenase-like predicted oxidoreductase